ncbi:MAG: 3-methyladenine glycosylase [Micrococcaceae bacterium]|nr:3-methyladenine glycosylase [Micrococcaceae bacterium]
MRALRLVADGYLTRRSPADVAAILDTTAEKLDGNLRAEFDVALAELAAVGRIEAAVQLLIHTVLPVANVARAVGFMGTPALEAALQGYFGCSPNELRQAHPSPATSGIAGTPGIGGALRIRLEFPFPLPYDTGIFGFLAARAVPGVEYGDDHRYGRVLALPRGHARFDVVCLTAGAVLNAELEHPGDLPVLLNRVRRLLNLDADATVIDAALRLDPGMRRLVDDAPGIRLPGALDPGEILIRALIGQQVTVAAARTALGRLAEAGTASRVAGDGLVRHFPTPAQVAEHGPELLRGPRRRIDTICRTAEALADGSLQLHWGDTPNTLAEKLLPLPGIGPWTVGYVAMRVLSAPDVFLPTDVAVRNGLAWLGSGERPGPKAAEEYGEQFRPWRSYATLHLWRAAAARR